MYTTGQREVVENCGEDCGRKEIEGGGEGCTEGCGGRALTGSQ